MMKLWGILDMMNIKMKINMKEEKIRNNLEEAIEKIEYAQYIPYHKRIVMYGYNELVQRADRLAMLLIKI